MKNLFITLAVIGCAGLVALGLYGLTKSHTSTPDSRIETPTARHTDTSSSQSGTRHYQNLDIVNIPEGTPSQLKRYEGFIVSFNADNKTPNYVAWELLGDETEGVHSRKNNFWQDSEIEGCPTPADYTRSGYDRGHLCPAADQKWSDLAMNDCFVMANMCPQDHSLNSGAWATLENKERIWAKRDSAIIIVAGPIYDKTDRSTIGNAAVRVPSAFFKVIAAPYLDNPRGIGFVYPNFSSPGNMQNYSMTIDEVEKITGYDFFYNLPDSLEEAVESVASFKEWNSSR